MKKAVKIILGAVLAVVALVVVLVLALPLWIGPVATGVANKVVPGITGTDFTLGEFALNPYSGTLCVGAMELGNPKSYKEKTAVRLDRFSADLGMTTVFGKVVHVEDVTLDGLYVYASGLTGANFQEIADHATGGKAKADGKPAEAQKPVDVKKPGDVEQPAEAKKSGEEGKKVCIDHLALRNIKIKIGMMPAMPVPALEFRDLGKPKDKTSEGGITLEELWQTIVEKVMATVGVTGDGLKALGNFSVDGAKSAGAAAGKAVNAVGDGAKSAGAAAGKAVNAVGDGAKKTVDALKSLF